MEVETFAVDSEIILDACVVVVGCVVIVVPSEHVADSSPSEAIENLFAVMTAALLESPARPVEVPVTG